MHGGELRDFVELPVSWELDDAPYFLFSFFPYMSGHGDAIAGARDLEGGVRRLVRGGGCFLLVVHPFCIGRHPRIAMLDELIDYIKSFPDVWFAHAPRRRRGMAAAQVEQGTWDGASALLHARP